MVVKILQNVNLVSLDVPPQLVMLGSVIPRMSQLVVFLMIFASLQPVPMVPLVNLVLLPLFVQLLLISVILFLALLKMEHLSVRLKRKIVAPLLLDVVILDVMQLKVAVLLFLKMVFVKNLHHVSLGPVMSLMESVLTLLSTVLIPTTSHLVSSTRPFVSHWNVIDLFLPSHVKSDKTIVPKTTPDPTVLVISSDVTTELTSVSWIKINASLSLL